VHEASDGLLAMPIAALTSQTCSMRKSTDLPWSQL